MDIYLFYNCFNNFYDLYNTDIDELNSNHEKIFNNPLVLYNYYNYLQNDDNKDNYYIYDIIGGGKGDKGAKKAGKVEKKGKLKKIAEADKAKAAEIRGKYSQKFIKNLTAPSTSKKPTTDTDEIFDILKSFFKVIIGILVVVCIPIVPWILISFYAFKNLFEFIKNNMSNL
jgi:hypothetical protein